jgi:transglutaminase-like putative cysteine protease
MVPRSRSLRFGKPGSRLTEESDVPDPMDFCAWFEVYLIERWYTFDARHNTPRLGRILGHGRHHRRRSI